jgi:hypothetical protein
MSRSRNNSCKSNISNNYNYNSNNNAVTNNKNNSKDKKNLNTITTNNNNGDLNKSYENKRSLKSTNNFMLNSRISYKTPS